MTLNRKKKISYPSPVQYLDILFVINNRNKIKARKKTAFLGIAFINICDTCQFI